MEPAGAIDEAEVAAAEAHEVAAAIVLGQSHCLARQGFADEDVLAAPFDRAVVAHLANLVVGIVPGCGGLRGHHATWRRPAARGCRLFERLVRAVPHCRRGGTR